MRRELAALAFLTAACAAPVAYAADVEVVRAARLLDVAAGRYGDLIAVAGDPLADVTTLEKPVFVMKDGVVVKQP